MSEAEKARKSGDSPRPVEMSTLPTVNPEVKESARPTKPALHPAFYVMCDAYSEMTAQ